MRYSTAAVITLWLLPSILFCEQESYIRAKTLVRRTLQDLSPPADAVFNFRQTSRYLGHLSRPWQTGQRDAAGTFSVAGNSSSFYQADSLSFGGAVYSSFTYCSDTTLVVIGYGSDTPRELTLADKEKFPYDVAALTPVFLLKDFLTHDRERSFLRYVTGPVDSIAYKTDDGTIISLAIDAGVKELKSVSILYSHELYGDVVRTVEFSDYTVSEANGFKYPSRIIQKELGVESSVVSVDLSRQAFDKERIMAMIPSSYHLKADPPKLAEQIARIDYNARIHFLDLEHADSRVLVVEFKEYLLVAEAPLNTRNGEMIIEKTREIAPGKPIRYFVFGHHHPHYLGGIRAFVHNGATIIIAPSNSAYVRQLVSFRHSLKPDSLEMAPRPLKLELLDREKIISDGEIEMRIIHIGEMSNHTEDYLIYYFPKEKLLFQDDLASMPKGKPRAATKRQKGLYDAIKLHNLDVDTIVQGWPLESDAMKTTFSFEELERSVEMIVPKN